MKRIGSPGSKDLLELILDRVDTALSSSGLLFEDEDEDEDEDERSSAELHNLPAVSLKEYSTKPIMRVEDIPVPDAGKRDGRGCPRILYL